MGEQISLAEALLHPKLGANAKLDAMHEQVDWTPIGRLAAMVRAPAATGRKPYPALPMTRQRSMPTRPMRTRSAGRG